MDYRVSAQYVDQDIDKPSILQAVHWIELPHSRGHTYNLRYGAQSLLDRLPGARTACRLSATHLVGIGRNHSHRVHRLVGGLPQ